MRFPDLDAVERHLNSLVNYEQAFPVGGARNRPKLDPSLRAIERLGLSRCLPACVHVAGTKGKGSVVSFLEALLAPDNPLLSFTSPHLMSFVERVRGNGLPLPEPHWQRGFEEITNTLARDPAISLTYFESTWIMFLWAARQLNTRVHVVEAGLGGTWDATNVLEDSMAVLTAIDYDHTEVLGNTLTEIAADKSGIIKSKSRVVVGRQQEEALRVIRRAARAGQARAHYFDEEYRWVPQSGDLFRYEDEEGSIEGLSLTTPGLHQRDNAAIAIRVARLLAPALPPSRIRERLRSCVIPARQQLFPGSPDVLVDVAHNPVSFRALAETLRTQYTGRKIVAVIGMMSNKDARASLAALPELVSDIVFVELNSPRSASPQDLLVITKELGFNADVSTSREEAFQELHRISAHDLGLIVGSFYLAGDYLLWRMRAGIA
ncbi:MAG: cyanophycin synthetase [bacterium]|nr:cyanophycin synthetase [bacterium]